MSGTIKWVKSKELAGTFILDNEEKITNDALENSAIKNISQIHNINSNVWCYSW